MPNTEISRNRLPTFESTEVLLQEIVERPRNCPDEQFHKSQCPECGQPPPAAAPALGLSDGGRAQRHQQAISLEPGPQPAPVGSLQRNLNRRNSPTLQAKSSRSAIISPPRTKRFQQPENNWRQLPRELTLLFKE